SYIKDLQLKYNNIFLYEKKYASLNELRKLGIEKATGEYIIFVLPEDTINLNALAVLAEALEKENADMAIGSFLHPYYNHYLKNKVYDVANIMDLASYQHDIFISTMLTGKLYKKSLFDEFKIKDLFLNEAIIQLKLLTKMKKIVTTEKVLFVAKEFYTSFETFRFWENKKSFLNKCVPILEYQEKFLKRNKNLFPAYVDDDLIYLRALDYLFWELLVYAKHTKTVEALTMEMVQALKSEFFLSYINKISSAGLTRKKLGEDELLANCILFADLLLKKLSSVQEEMPQIHIIKICYMLFIKIFYRQVGVLNTTQYLCELREELNLNDTREAKFINSLHL
ncbi:MAG: glycosyltransferase, partial [Anaeroplasmataceae bacterium]|nr:glycosyltransferase [Anaeroplasmataceae bacterium]